MTNGLFSLFSSLIANTPPFYRKGLSSRKFLSLFLILFLAVGNAWGAEVIFKSSNKNDDGSAFAALSNGDTQLVGNGLAKMIATDKVSLGTAANKYGYRCDGGRLYIVFKFDGETDLTIKHNANSTGDRYMSLYSFSSTKALKDIASTDWGEKEQVPFTSLESPEGWEGGAASTVTTADYKKWNYSKKGCLNVVWENLPAGYYVLYGTGSEAYIYGFEANVTPSAPATANLTWNFDGGSCSGIAGTDYTAAGAVAIGGEIKYPADATMSKDGYNFNGWDSDETEMPATDLTITAQWVSASATESAITYADTKGADVTAFPTTYYEGTGVASFEPIADVTDYHFVGWVPASISTEATGDQTITAQWVSAYNIEFNAGTGIGEVPATFQKWEGATFELPTQGALVAPAGKEFAGWSDGTNTYNAGDTYTMGAAAVTFTAQWKAAPTVIFHYQWTGSSTQPAVGDVLTGIGGTITVERKEGSEKNLSNESAKFVSSVPSDMKFTTSDSKGVKFGTSDVWFRIALNSGNFEEGDMIAICGYEAFLISSSTAFDGDISSSLSTGSNKENYEVKQCVIPSIESFPNLYIRRVSSTCGFAAIKVIRPAQKEILSTDITLSAVAVNTEPISADNLATLKTDPYKLDLTSEFVEAPTVAFTNQTVITYEDATTKTKTENIEVVAAKVDGKWQAQAEINGVTYTVTAKVPAAYTVIYKDGGTELASESVKVGEHPTAEGVESKPLYTLSWKLGEEVVELSDVNGTADQEIILTAVWAPKYAISLDFAAVTTDGKTGDNPIVDFLASGNMVASNLGGSEWETSTSKSGYVGYKLKNSGATITFLAQEGKRVTITFGSIAADVTLKKGDETVTISAQSGDGAETVYNLDVTTDMVVAITTSNGSTVTLKSITIGEIPTISDDATLKDLKVNGETIDGFSRTTDSYYVEMPYGTQKADLPLVTATANHGKAAVIVQDAKDRPDDTRATIKVTAEDGTTIKHYYVYFTNAAKEGVNLVKATIGDNSIALVANESYIKSAIVQNEKVDGRDGGVSAGSKFQKNSYIKIEMPAGQQFRANDIVDLEVTGVGGTYKLLVYSENSTAAEKLVVNEATAPTLVVGHNKVQLNKDAQALYLVRDGSNNWNPHVKSIIVQRYMAPFIESFVIGEAKGNIDQANKTIAVEVLASADVTALTPTIVAWANGGATVTPTDAQNFTYPVEYSVASKYEEDGTTKYTVTVTKAAASTDATLATLTYNGTNITLVPDQYTYDIELPKGTTVVPTVTYTTNHTGATADMTDAADLPGATRIIVKAEDGATQEYVINFTVSRAISYVIYDGSVQQNIESRTGNDATGFSWSMGSNVTINGSKVPSSWNGKNYTYVIKGFKPNKSTNNITSIVIPTGYLAKITLVGTTNSEGEERSLFIATSASSNKEDAMGDYIITSSDFNVQGFTTDYLQAGTYYLGSTEACRLYELSVVLYPIDYTRDVRQGYYGTICLPNKGQMIGAAVYEIAYMDYKDGAPYKIYFDEILNGKMEAGVPYVFLPNEGYNQLMVTYTAIFDAAADDANGLYGFIGTSATDEFPIPGGVGNYIIQNNQYREVLAGADARIVSNRAYIKLSEVPGYNNPLYVAPAPAPGRKRIAMGTTGAQVATGVDQVEGDEVPTKMIINGQLFILRGEKMYDAQGKLVK